MAERWDNDTSPVDTIPKEQEQDQRAVAIKYDVKNDRAPRVTAKGRSLVADRILAEARKNGISRLSEQIPCQYADGTRN